MIVLIRTTMYYILLVIIAIGLTNYCLKHSKRYHIHQDSRVFETDFYTDGFYYDEEGCICFFDYDGEHHIICGNYTIN